MRGVFTGGNIQENMKKLLAFLILIILFSCEKQVKEYWLCTNIIIRSIPGYIPDTICYKQTYNLTSDDMAALIRFQTYEGTQEYNGVIMNIESKTSCGKLVCPQ